MENQNIFTHEKRLSKSQSVMGAIVMLHVEDCAVWLGGGGDEYTLTPYEALGFLAWLQEREAMLRDRVENYYDCRECGGVHHKDVKRCPAIGWEDEEV